jgi:hypothetical protein
MPASLYCPTRRTARSGSTRRRWVMSRWSAVLGVHLAPRRPGYLRRAVSRPGSCPTLFPVSDGLVSTP